MATPATSFQLSPLRPPVSTCMQTGEKKMPRSSHDQQLSFKFVL